MKGKTSDRETPRLNQGKTVGQAKKITYRLATRRSLLALRQSKIVAEALKRSSISPYPKTLKTAKAKEAMQVEIKLVEISTEADRNHGPLSVNLEANLSEKTDSLTTASQQSGKVSLFPPDTQVQGVFVKELETALLEGRADFAVHSLKDMPFRQPKGTMIVAYLPRADVQDVMVFKENFTLKTLPSGSVVGTSSLRRILFLKKAYPHLDFRGIRGNLQTRLKKLEKEDFTAIVLAKAGLDRLQIKPPFCQSVPLKVLPPAPGQAIIAVQCRTKDAALKKWLRHLNDSETELCALAERRAMHLLQAGCRLPFAAHAVFTLGVMKLSVVMARMETHRVKRCTVFAEVDERKQAIDLGRLAAKTMKKKLRR